LTTPVSNVGELVPLGLFILLFLQSFVLARRFSEAFKDVRALSQKLLNRGRYSGGQAGGYIQPESAKHIGGDLS